ncbi:myosin regulatory light chain cardiac muscle protein, putative [Babesia ovis]|uniref:Myosin regulatory light chain cardiac muscle protein, putative n=1 Tax=Babesia ovis TaxID=5869 RepID=A0A9W5TBT1_BABOV|nr:myosin regulatory light chain cardiac muscle protein, putative [Babesia ovis]
MAFRKPIAWLATLVATIVFFNGHLLSVGAEEKVPDKSGTKEKGSHKEKLSNKEKLALKEKLDQEIIAEQEQEPIGSDIFTKTTFFSRMAGYATDAYTSSTMQKRGHVEMLPEDKDSEETPDVSDKDKDGRDADSEYMDAFDIRNIFAKYKTVTYTPDELAEKIREILTLPDPLYGTAYNTEWGRACLTDDGTIPRNTRTVHFDIFDPFLPPGLLFEDLGCLHLYNVAEGYNLYKIRFGDMVITLRLDLEQVSMHLFEDSWGLMVVRLLFAVDGIFNRHEYTETSRGSRVFRKTMGQTIQHAPPPLDTMDINTWLDQKYRLLSAQRPPLIEEVLTKVKA